MLSLSGNLSRERCKVKHFTEYGLKRIGLLLCKKLDVINEQRFDRLFSTVCVFIDHGRHVDKRNLALGSPWWIQFEVCDSFERAKRSETVTFLYSIAA